MSNIHQQSALQLQSVLHPVESLFAYRFAEPGLLKEALTHRSMRVHGSEIDYEQLEYLGDRVLRAAILETLVQNVIDDPKERHRRYHFAVGNGILGNAAFNAGLSDHITSAYSGGAGSPYDPKVLADVVEAIVGAIFLEAGFDQAKASLLRFLGSRMDFLGISDPEAEVVRRLESRNAGGTVECDSIRPDRDGSPSVGVALRSFPHFDVMGFGSTIALARSAAFREALNVLEPQSLSGLSVPIGRAPSSGSTKIQEVLGYRFHTPEIGDIVHLNGCMTRFHLQLLSSVNLLGVTTIELAVVNYCIQEIGDCTPKELEHARTKTLGNDRLTYIGHSLGFQKGDLRVDGCPLASALKRFCGAVAHDASIGAAIPVIEKIFEPFIVLP